MSGNALKIVEQKIWAAVCNLMACGPMQTRALAPAPIKTIAKTITKTTTKTV